MVQDPSALRPWADALTQPYAQAAQGQRCWGVEPIGRRIGRLSKGVHRLVLTLLMMGDLMLAKYESRCRGCSSRTERGSEIQLRDGQWMCMSCAALYDQFGSEKIEENRRAAKRAYAQRSRRRRAA